MSSFTFTWENGRQLSTATKGSYTLSFKYDENGHRTSKTVNGVKHTYHLSGSQIIAEEWGDNLLVYLYDAEGSPIGMQYRTTSYAEGVFDTFWFEKNLQGDIVSVYNAQGTKLLTYHYDAWGNYSTQWHNYTGTNNYASYNPLKYRGYYQDSETGFYYLQSRYYDPFVGRFINSDGQLNGGMLGYNLFAYCENNPVNRIDPTGNAWWHWALGAAVVAGFAALTVATCAGSLALAASSMALVASGTAAATTATTVAAAATIGAAGAYGAVVISAALDSSSAADFAEHGDWGTVISPVFGAVFGGLNGYSLAKAQIPNSTQTTTVYRSVSNAEAQDVKATGRFNLSPYGMDCKQFGFNLNETKNFGNMMGQTTIVSADVPTNMLGQFYTGGVDTSIFRGGTLTVYGNLLDIFNEAVYGTIKFIE